MIEIRRYPFVRLLRSDASSHLIKFSGGKVRKSGRGLSFLFRPETESIMELPMDDRDMVFVVNAQSADFQDIMVQGNVLWRIADVDAIASRVDFSIDLDRGEHVGRPIEHIRNLLTAVVQQATTDYLKAMKVRDVLDAGLGALKQSVAARLKEAQELSALGLEPIALHVSNLTPSPELARALQMPTFESIQQAADEATFKRRALAVEKEQEIAENELRTQIELAKREAELIDNEASNARQRAEGDAKAEDIRSESQARSIRVIEEAKTEAEKERLEVYKLADPTMVMALAAREAATKLRKIENLNVTPELVSAFARELNSAIKEP